VVDRRQKSCLSKLKHYNVSQDVTLLCILQDKQKQKEKKKT